MSELLPSSRQIGRERPAETCALVVLVALALSGPIALYFVSTSVRAAAHGWLDAFRPVVYLSVDQSDERAHSLKREITDWRGVGGVQVRPPDEGLETVRRRLGPRSIEEMELTESMFPYSLVVELESHSGRELDLVSRLSALQTRDAIEAVDVPSSRTQSLLTYARWGGWGGLVAGVLGLATTVLQMTWVLEGQLRTRRDLIASLVRHGATPAQLKRYPLTWGTTLGAWGGGLGFALLLGVGIVWYRLEAHWFGGHTGLESAWRWGLLVVPLLLGPLLGYGAGRWSVSTSIWTHFKGWNRSDDRETTSSEPSSS